MQKLQESGPFDKFTAAGRTSDLDFSLPSRDTDFLSAMRTAVDFVCFGIADHTFVPFAEPDNLLFCVHIHTLFFASFPDIFGKHAVIHPDQQNPADIVQCRCPQQTGKQDAYQCSHQQKPGKMVDPISALHKFFEFLSHTNLHSAAKSAAQIVMKVFQFSTLLIKYFLKKLHYKARGGES